LNESYFDIYATNDKNYNTLKGACFVIKRFKINSMSYEEKAFEIVKESIKSAIFIDEKARTFFRKMKN
jgi:hypothetical protein